MGLSVRDWMVIVGVLLVVAVLLDGYRRMRQEWRSQIRTSLSKAGSDKDGLDLNSELPNGGARVVARGEQRPARVEPRISYAVDPLHNRAARAARHDADRSEEFADTVGAEAPMAWSDAADADTPQADDSDDTEAGSLGQFSGSGSGAARSRTGDTVVDRAPAETSPERWSPDSDPVDPVPDDDSGDMQHPDHWMDDDDRVHSGSGIDSSMTRTSGDIASRSASPSPLQPEPADAVSTFESPDEAPSLGPADEVVVINVLAKDRPFAGPELLQILLACDLRFGKMNIFHRYEQAGGKGPLQFSVANIVEPGVFNLDRIDDFSTRGVCFFLTLPGPQEPLVAFNYMVETAQCLVRNLNGELRDEAHSVMTAQTLEHCRARIREFERRQLTRPPR